MRSSLRTGINDSVNTVQLNRFYFYYVYFSGDIATVERAMLPV